MEIKTVIKKIIKMLPGFNILVKKNELLKLELDKVKYDRSVMGRKLVDYRLKLKAIKNEKINVVFVCHRPAVWETLHSIYNAMKTDDRYNVSIVAIPNKKELPRLNLNHEIYESEGAEEFWKEYGCINGYNYETHEWFDLKQLEPDYVFFQQPYNITKPEVYKSWNVSQYAKICYLNYFSPVNFGDVYDECTPVDFIRDIAFYFTQNKRDNDFILDRYNRIGYHDTEVIMTGYPRYDDLDNLEKDSDIWSDKKHKKFRLVWTPRWTTNEGNCHFFEFKDYLIDFCKKNDVELVFRPHPQAFKEWETTGELTPNERKELIEQFESDDRLHLDESKNYYGILYSSDCLLTDPSSLIYDYFLTTKPIIYAMGKSKNDVSDLLQDGLYIVKNWEQTERELVDLINKKDKLYNKRVEMTNTAFYINKNGAGNEISRILKGR